MKVCVVGAGPAGLSAAYHITKQIADVILFEAANSVGGMARSIQLWGQRVDLGPHRFFSQDPRVNEFWLEVIGRDYFMIKRQTRILYGGRLFNYPLQAFDAMAKLGPLESARCIASYLKNRLGWQRVSDHRAGNGVSQVDLAEETGISADLVKCVSNRKGSGSFEDWVCHRFGRRLFKIFFKTYSEKLWGIPCNELDADFAAQRIKRLSLSEAIKSALFPSQRKRHRTLADEFAYPIGGTGMVYERMAGAIEQRGGQVRLNMPVKKVLTRSTRSQDIESLGSLGSAVSLSKWESELEQPGSRRPPGKSRRFACAPLHKREVIGIELASGETIGCKHVISTMPLTALVMQLDDVPANVINACRQLRFRNTILTYLEVIDENPFPDQWIYVHSPQLRFGRVTNFANWKPRWEGRSPRQETNNSKDGAELDPLRTILAMEYWCDAEDAFWKSTDECLVSLAGEEIVKSGLLRDSARLGRRYVFRIPKCYPVYRRGYQEYLQVIREFLDTISGLQVIGRYGSFKYNNQDHSILMGILAAENFLGYQHDLWNVNSDCDTYQEGCRITETGLTTVGTHEE